MLLLTHSCALSLCLWWPSSALDPHFPSTTVRNAGVKCVMGLQMLFRKDVGKQRKNEKRGTLPL